MPGLAQICSRLHLAALVFLGIGFSIPSVGFTQEESANEELAAEFSLYSPDNLDTIKASAPIQVYEPFQFPTDWDLRWQMSSGEIYWQPSRFIVLQQDIVEDPEFDEASMGILLSLNSFENKWLNSFLRATGTMAVVSWISMPVKKFRDRESLGQFKYLFQVPVFRETLSERLNWNVHIAQNVNTNDTSWIVENQIRCKLFGDLQAAILYRYGTWDEPRKWNAPWYGVEYIAQF